MKSLLELTKLRKGACLAAFGLGESLKRYGTPVANNQCVSWRDKRGRIQIKSRVINVVPGLCVYVPRCVRIWSDFGKYSNTEETYTHAQMGPW